MHKLRSSALAALLAGSIGPAQAVASGPPDASAEQLFQAARVLLKRGDLAAACPKFLESYRLEPATGTLLGVAACHEQQGLLASAWREFTQAAESAREEGRSDRETIALKRAEALRPRLSTLMVALSAELMLLPGLQVFRNGELLDASEQNRVLPVDGGQYLIEVRAPGHVALARQLTVAAAGDQQTLVLPTLAPLAPPPGAGEQAAQSSASPSGSTPTRVVGLGLGAAALGVAVVSGIFFKVALDKKGESEPWCEGRRCYPEGLELRADAVAWGNRATACGVGSAALLATGIGLYYFGRPDAERPSSALSVALDPQRRAGAASLRIGF